MTNKVRRRRNELAAMLTHFLATNPLNYISARGVSRYAEFSDKGVLNGNDEWYVTCKTYNQCDGYARTMR